VKILLARVVSMDVSLHPASEKCFAHSVEITALKSMERKLKILSERLAGLKLTNASLRPANEWG
jgi:hypothetical protein